jgi:hypothetical protein
LDPAALDLTRQWNTLDDTNNAIDPLDFLLFNGHGTATASLMISSSSGQLTGVAPAARLLPIRCARSVVLVLDTELAQAVWYAIGQQTDVLSISLGGLPMPHLEAVISHAVRTTNMIVCASAGNLSPFVVYPAAYRDCLAVAGTTPTDRPWAKSSFGPSVAISAPAHLVWVGDFDDQRNPVAASPGHGTSFSAPYVAAAAARWLSQHGKSQLIQKYAGTTNLSTVFRRLLAQTARRPGPFPAPGETGDVAEGMAYTWDQTRYGPGILDVGSLLAAPLPPASDFVPPAPSPTWSWLDALDHIFPDLPRAGLVDRLSAVAGSPITQATEFINRFGAELTQILIEEPAAREAFLSLVPEGAAPEEGAVAESGGQPAAAVMKEGARDASITPTAVPDAIAARDLLMAHASATLGAAVQPPALELR